MRRSHAARPDGRARRQRPDGEAIKKLDYKRLGPFKKLRLSTGRAYRLKIPNSMEVHDVFHVSLSDRYVKPGPGQ
jgi:hypothetical protein